jgi:uncharacterized protein (DUF169 family)
MRPLKTDLSIYRQFNFEKPPVGVKYLTTKPEGIAQLDKSLALCEMLKEAQQSEAPFYISQENENCFGKRMLGMGNQAQSAGSGQIGVELGIFQDARANWRLYQYQTQMKGAVNYVVFSPLEKITFEPDLLFIMGTVDQAEIVMRAMSYSTGEKWTSNLTGVGACAWLFAYPYVSGKVNYAITGMSFGMRVKRVFPAGWMLISIPYDWIPVITRNLNEMQWVLPAYTESKEEFREREKRIIEQLYKE